MTGSPVSPESGTPPRHEIVVDATSRYAWHAATVLALLIPTVRCRRSWIGAYPTAAVWMLDGEPMLP